MCPECWKNQSGIGWSINGGGGGGGGGGGVGDGDGDCYRIVIICIYILPGVVTTVCLQTWK